MNANEVALKLTPSRVVFKDHPGHVSIAYLGDSGKLIFRGFRFYVTDLPAEYQPASRFRDYLFEHAVPGYVMDDVGDLRRFEQNRDQFRSGTWKVARAEEFEALKEMVVPARVGNYSFNPDDFEDCNNCVTWACHTVHKITGETVVSIPRQGRIKLLAKQLPPAGK